MRDSEAAASVNSKVVITLLLLTITSVCEGETRESVCGAELDGEEVTHPPDYVVVTVY